MLAIALVLNVAPVDDGVQRTLQAASPVEVALVKFAESVGVILRSRSMSRVTLKSTRRQRIVLRCASRVSLHIRIKANGYHWQDQRAQEITLYVKGADTVMPKKGRYNDWLYEECGNLAREGLKTLVSVWRDLIPAEYNAFGHQRQNARTPSIHRKEAMEAIQSDIETDMNVLVLAGVEVKLQPDVREPLEKLRHARIRIWMLTGDKVETGICITLSSRLAERSGIYTITGVMHRNEASRALSRFRSSDVLVADGTSLQVFLDIFPKEFLELASMAPAAVACRCSPTQKAPVVRLL